VRQRVEIEIFGLISASGQLHYKNKIMIFWGGIFEEIFGKAA